MTLTNLTSAIEILRPYYDTADGDHVGTDRGQIYLHKTDRPLSTEDVVRMRKLGWFQRDDDYDDETGEPTPESYDPDESWIAFVRGEERR